MIRVTEALPKDVFNVYNFRQALTEEERGLPMTDTEVCELIAEVGSVLATNTVTILLAWDGELPVGAVWCYGYPLIGKNDGRVMRVDQLYIVPEYRKSRALAALWVEVHRLADKYGIERMQGTVTDKNAAVKRMWMKRGAFVRAEILEKTHGIESEHSSQELQQAAASGNGSSGPTVERHTS